MRLSIPRLLGLGRAGDFFFALADATAVAAAPWPSDRPRQAPP
jgi:hypothetical protein